MSPNGVGGGGGLIERGALLQKNDFQPGSLLERGGGEVNSEVGFNRDFKEKQLPDYNFLMSTFGPM